MKSLPNRTSSETGPSTAELEVQLGWLRLLTALVGPEKARELMATSLAPAAVHTNRHTS